MVLKPIIFVLLMQFTKASYLFVVTMKTFNRIALGHTHMCCMKHSYVKNDDTTLKALDGRHIVGYYNYYSLSNILCKTK